jgi:hypothetical protein
MSHKLSVPNNTLTMRSQVQEECWRSGICSEACFLALNGIPLFLQDAELDHPGRPAHEVRLLALVQAAHAVCRKKRAAQNMNTRCIRALYGAGDVDQLSVHVTACCD